MKPDPSSSRISLRDIAKELSVSHSTVSLALRNHPRISEEVRERVKRKAEEMGYKPDPMLAALANYRRGKNTIPITASIAWLNAWPEPEKLRGFKEFDCYWQGAFAAAEKFGYRLEEFQFGKGFTPERLHQILSTRGIRGMLIPPHQNDPDWGGFPWNQYSVVRFGRSLQNPRTHLVTSDQVANTMLAFEEIWKRGYRRIGFVTNEKENMSRGHLFEAGYLIAQRTIPEELRLPIFVTSGLSVSECQQAFNVWLEENKPDAIFTDYAHTSQMIIRAGKSVPEDIGLAVTSTLDARADAGIDQHPEEIGRAAFLMLNSLINDGALGIPKIFRQILVEGSWVDGGTLPPKPGC